MIAAVKIANDVAAFDEPDESILIIDDGYEALPAGCIDQAVHRLIDGYGFIVEMPGDVREHHFLSVHESETRAVF